MNLDLLSLIKQSGSIREFKDKNVPRSLVNKIIEAGIWGPSILAIQPWDFVVLLSRKSIFTLSEIINKDAELLGTVPQKVAKMASLIIKKSPLIIIVYNNAFVQQRARKYGRSFVKRAMRAELQATGAAIQNMFLMANSLGLGVVWLDAPTFCEDSINKHFKEERELIAVLAIGYPNQHAHRSPRYLSKDSIAYIN